MKCAKPCLSEPSRQIIPGLPGIENPVNWKPKYAHYICCCIIALESYGYIVEYWPFHTKWANLIFFGEVKNVPSLYFAVDMMRVDPVAGENSWAVAYFTEAK